MENLFKNCQKSKQQGNVGHLLAMSYYASLGWSISNPITDSNDYDFIAEDQEGNLFRIQVKTSRYLSDNGSYVVNLVTSGGNQKEYWRKELNTSILDFLFVVTDNGDCYSIPISEVSQVSSLTLYEKYKPFIVMKVNTDIAYQAPPEKEKIQYYCPNCGAIVSGKGRLCKKCAAQQYGLTHRKVERPDRETLLNQLSTSNMSKVGEYYGVSDNAVRKWLKGYGLPTSIKILKEQELI